MSKRYGYMFIHLKQSCMPRKDFTEMENAVKSTTKKVVPPMVDKRVNKIAKKLVPLYVGEGLLLDRQKAQTDIAALVVEAVKKEQENLRAKLFISSVHDFQYQLYLKMKDDEQACNADLSLWWSLKLKFEKPAPPIVPCRNTVVLTRDHKDHYDDGARREGESNAKRQRTSEHGTYSMGKSSSKQVMDESNPSGQSTQEQLDEFDAWKDDFGTDNVEVPSKEVSPKILEEISGKIDEAQL
ncbi:hypothetical protein Tco_0340909 [Tanacetum coccineum]